jgi:hypothetical protein
MSKGSNQRPTDPAKFGEGYERVFRGEAPPSFGFVVTDPDNYAVAAHRRPTTKEQHAINEYRYRYTRTFFGETPKGIHVLPVVGITVFLPNE